MATNRIGNRQERSRQVRSATPVAPWCGGLSRRPFLRCCLAGALAGMLSTLSHAGTVLVPGGAGRKVDLVAKEVNLVALE